MDLQDFLADRTLATSDVLAELERVVGIKKILSGQIRALHAAHIAQMEDPHVIEVLDEWVIKSPMGEHDALAQADLHALAQADLLRKFGAPFIRETREGMKQIHKAFRRAGVWGTSGLLPGYLELRLHQKGGLAGTWTNWVILNLDGLRVKLSNNSVSCSSIQEAWGPLKWDFEREVRKIHDKLGQTLRAVAQLKEDE